MTETRQDVDSSSDSDLSDDNFTDDDEDEISEDPVPIPDLVSPLE